jgi:hypothetical protein
VTRTQSFHREPVKGLFLLLAFTEVEDLLRKSKDARFSLIYRNDNFRKELEAGVEKTLSHSMVVKVPFISMVRSTSNDT